MAALASTATPTVSFEKEEPAPAAPRRDVLELQTELVDLMNANDMKGFEARVAADALVRSLLEPGRAATGRDKLMVKVSEISGKLKGRLAPATRAALKVSGTRARCACTIKLPFGGGSVVVGLEFGFSGDLVVDLGLAKGPPADFLDPKHVVEKVVTTTEPTAPPLPPAVVVAAAPALPLVPRPAAFPPRVVQVDVRGVTTPLASPYVVPRLLNPYVKLAVASSSVTARTKVLFNTKTPDWRGQRLTLVLPEGQEAERLEILVMDLNAVRRNQWLCKASLALASLRACESRRLEIPLDVRKSITSQDVVRQGTAQALIVDVVDYDVARWWALEERAAHEAAAAAAEEAAEQEARRLADLQDAEQQQQGTSYPDEITIDAAPRPPRPGRWWHLW